LWHGSSWLFVIWGGLNGLGVLVHKLWQKVSPFREGQGRVVRAGFVFLTLCFISFTRIFFRSRDMETVNEIFNRIGRYFSLAKLPEVLAGYSPVFLLLLLGYLIHWLPDGVKSSYRSWFAGRSYGVQVLLSALVVLAMYQLMTGEMQPFIYFQF
jgi:alginate O-acetyltransferase complex protein AlgI